MSSQCLPCGKLGAESIGFLCHLSDDLVDDQGLPPWLTNLDARLPKCSRLERRWVSLLGFRCRQRRQQMALFVKTQDNGGLFQDDLTRRPASSQRLPQREFDADPIHRQPGLAGCRVQDADLADFLPLRSEGEIIDLDGARGPFRDLPRQLTAQKPGAQPEGTAQDHRGQS